MTPARAEIRETASFAITVDFVRGKGDPSRPFRTMIGLTESLRRFDRDLMRSVDITLEPVLVLEDVEAGSIKSWFASVLRSTDDAAIRSGDWKKVAGEYLVKAKYIFLEKVAGASSVTQPGLLEDIQSALLAEAEKTNIRMLPGYVPMSRTHLAAHVADVTSSLEYLEDGDSATFESQTKAPVKFNKDIRVDEQELNDLLAIRTVSNVNELIIKIKKPDFIGSSMWEFHFDGHTIEAKVTHEEWLERFRADGLGVRPGAALRAMVKIEVSYDDENESLPAKYTVLEILEVLPPPEKKEQLLLTPGV